MFPVGSIRAKRCSSTAVPAPSASLEYPVPIPRLLWLVGVSRREQAEALRGSWLYVPEKDVPAAEEGEFFHYQLLGMAVYTEEDELLGEIGEILETGSNDVYVVKGPSKELLVPATAQVVRQVDVSGRRMTVRLLDGMR